MSDSVSGMGSKGPADSRIIVLRNLVVLIFGLVAIGCAASPSTSPIPPAATATDGGGATSTLPSDSAAQSPEGGPVTFASTLYPYALTLAADQMLSDWRPATKPWDGKTRVDNGTSTTDWVQVVDGNLFAFGAPTDAPMADFVDDLQAGAVAWHGCDATPAIQEPLAADGTDGTLIAYACGTTPVVRWTTVRGDFGLTVVELLVNADDPEAARQRFTEIIKGLRWSSGSG